MSTILGPQLSFQWRQGTVSQKQKLIAPLTIWPMKHIFGLWKKPQNPHRHNMPTPQRMDPLGLEPGTFSCCETIVLSTTVLSMTQASQTKSKFSNFYTYCNASHLHKRCRFRLMSVFRLQPQNGTLHSAAEPRSTAQRQTRDRHQRWLITAPKAKLCPQHQVSALVQPQVNHQPSTQSQHSTAAHVSAQQLSGRLDTFEVLED